MFLDCLPDEELPGMSLQIRHGALNAKVFILRRNTFKLADRFRPNPAPAFSGPFAFNQYPSGSFTMTDKIISWGGQRDWSYCLSIDNHLALLIRRRKSADAERHHIALHKLPSTLLRPALFYFLQEGRLCCESHR